MLSIKLPNDIAEMLANRLRQRRLEHNWTREELAARSGVTVASIRRFETTYQITLQRLLQLSFTLHLIDSFENLLIAPPALSLAELEKNYQLKTRKRARRKHD